MAQTVYKRQLVGNQSGVQVNMPIDTVERMLVGAGEQSFACVGQFTRGRIDKPFLVSASKLQRYLGKATRNNHTYRQMVDAFENGASGAVVSRVVSEQAKNQFIVVSNEWAMRVAESVNGADLFGLKIADCNQFGYRVEMNKNTGGLDGVNVKIFMLNQGDIVDETPAYEFSGSLNPDALNDVGESDYLPDVCAKYYGDLMTVQVNETLIENIVSGDEVLIELDDIAVAEKLQPFEDKGNPASEQYKQASLALGHTNIPYRYILGDSENTVIVMNLLNVAQKYNRILVQEISGSLNPSAAIAWKNNFQYDAQGGMYCLWVYSPIKRLDVLGMGGILQYGTVGQKIGKACARNAILNGFGLPPLNRPIAGKDFMLSGAKVEQIYFPDDTELAQLADNHINPVQYAEFHDGSGYVWDDSFSGAKKNGISKLENAVEISQWFQDRVGRYARGLLQKPMSEAIRLMTRFVEDECQAAQASAWLIPSTKLGGLAYTYTVEPSERNPEDEMQVILNIAIDGVVRRIFISQNMYSRN